MDRLFLEFQAALTGRYALERELGRGGMGVVYLARDLRLERVVAVKLLPPSVATATGVRERFLREARTAAGLSHPHIIPIHAVEEAGDFVYFVMAYVDGESLGARIRRDGRLKPHDAARVLREVAWGLAYAHGHGVVHRDVKPDNILLEQGSGRALIADFGIARVAAARAAAHDGELIGTPEYLSPEQASAGPLDGRSDLYSLGVVGYYALSGALPFTGPTVAALLTQHLAKTPPPLVVPGAPRQLVAAIERCLSKEPAARFQSGEELAAALAAAADARRDLPVPVRAFLAEGNPRGRAQMMAAWVGAALLIPLGLGVLLRAVFPASVPALFEYGNLAIAILLFGAAAATPLVLTVRRIRRLVGAGYARADVVHGITLELDRRREELEYMGGGKPSRFARLMRLKSYGALALAALSGAAAFVLPYPAIMVAFGVFGLSSATAVATGIAAHAAGGDHLADAGKRALRFWRGALGRWLFRLAGFGVRRAPGLPVADRPTEVALGAAAVELFEALPKDTRRALGDLPAVVRGLEAQVGQLRKDGRERTLGDALGALEAIRVDLLRLHGGLGTLEGLTADLAAARDIGTVVDALVEAEPDAQPEQ